MSIKVKHGGSLRDVALPNAVLSKDGSPDAALELLLTAAADTFSIPHRDVPYLRLSYQGRRIVATVDETRAGGGDADDADADDTNVSRLEMARKAAMRSRLSVFSVKPDTNLLLIRVAAEDVAELQTAAQQRGRRSGTRHADSDEDEATIGTIPGPLEQPEVTHLLQCCTSTTLPGMKIRQPRFAFTLYMEEEGEDAPAFPVCGPCAHTCFQMQHIHVMDRPAALERPFQCACSSVVADGHECFWHADAARGKLRVDERRQLRVAWAREQRSFTNDIVAELEREARVDQRKAIEKLTEQLRDAVENAEQYRDEQALAAARAVVPTAMLEERARSDLASSMEMGSPDAARGSTDMSALHHAILRQLVAWFYDDFFEWVTRPQCPRCEGGRTEPIPKARKTAVPTTEERMNWASTIELYECRDCEAEVRFPRYRKATRLLTYRKGRCGEFANCFALCATALGYEVRTVSSSADQAWNEVYSAHAGRWLHCDASKGLLDSRLNDESSRGKSHPYVFAVSTTDVVDVSLRYTTNALKYLKRDKYSETALSKLVRGFARSGAHRVPKGRLLALHDSRQAAEDRELAAPFTEEDGAAALFAADAAATEALTPTNIIDQPAFGGSNADAPTFVPVAKTLVALRQSIGAQQTAVDEAAGGAADGGEDSKATSSSLWRKISEAAAAGQAVPLLLRKGASVSFRPQSLPGCPLPVPLAADDALTPFTVFSFSAEARIAPGGQLTIAVGDAFEVRISVEEDGGRAANVAVAYPGLKTLSQHGQFGGHAPVIPVTGNAAAAKVALQRVVCADVDQARGGAFVKVGFVIDCLGVLRVAAAGHPMATTDDLVGAGAAASTVASGHALVPMHAVLGLNGSGHATITASGNAAHLDALTAVSSGP